MEHVSISPDASSAEKADFDRRALSNELGTADLAINQYRVSPGGRLPAGLHAHADQEELFVVLSGEATFETLDDGIVTVSVDEAIRFAPGEFQAGRNDGDEPMELLALGAPRESEDVRIPIACPDCGAESLRLDFGEGALTFVCPECATEREPADCPTCSGADLRVTLADGGEPIVACQDCGSTFDHPPVRGEW